MKHIIFVMMDPAKAGDIAAASDKARAGLPAERLQTLAMYSCLGTPFPGFPENTMLVISVIEAENSDDIAALTYPIMLAGAAVVSCVPVLELPSGDAGTTEKSLRG